MKFYNKIRREPLCLKIHAQKFGINTSFNGNGSRGARDHMGVGNQPMMQRVPEALPDSSLCSRQRQSQLDHSCLQLDTAGISLLEGKNITSFGTLLLFFVCSKHQRKNKRNWLPRPCCAHRIVYVYDLALHLQRVTSKLCFFPSLRSYLPPHYCLLWFFFFFLNLFFSPILWARLFLQ